MKPEFHTSPVDNPQTDDRVVITGVGLVCGLGLDVRSTWTRVVQGHCAFRPLTALQSGAGEPRTGAQADDLPEALLDQPGREVVYLRRAVAEALEQAGLRRARPCPPSRVAVVMGTTLHGMRHAGQFLRTGERKRLARFLAGSTVAELAREFDFVGPTTTLCSACASGLASVISGVTLLRAGLADVVIAGGYDPISEYAYGGFASMRLVSPGVLKPFSRHRAGMKLGEGYAAIILERAGGAGSRGVAPLAEVAGLGESCDAYHLSRPHPEGAGAAAAMRAALRTAGVAPPDISLIAAHATATAENDAAESAALSAAFGDALAEVRVVGFKSHVGHTLGGAGAVELVLSLTALREGVIPPTANVESGEAEFPGLRLAVGDARRAPLRHTLTSSLGFGGSNSCVVLRHPEQPAAAPAARLAHDVVITGIGVVLPGITGVEALVRHVFAAKPEAAPAAVGPIAPEVFADLLNAARVRRMTDYVKLTLAATGLALRDAGVSDPGEFGERCCAVLGTTHGSTLLTEKYYRQIVEEGLDAANPMWFAEGVPNAAAAHLGSTYGIKGLCQTAIGTRAAGMEALLIAFARIRAGVWERAIVGAADEHSLLVDDTYRELGLADRLTAAGASPSSGFWSGCGAVTLVLESGESARARGATPWAVVDAVAATRFSAPITAAAHVAELLTTLGRGRFVMGSAGGTWLDGVERRASLRAGTVPGGLHGRLGECFSAGPLAALATVLAAGRLPQLAAS